MMRSIFFTFLCIFCFSWIHAQDLSKTNAPNWVVPIQDYKDSIADDHEGVQYLIYDIQEHLEKEELYQHYAIKILNADGIQQYSNIDVTFDPTYQKLSFHFIKIIRDGKVIDKLQLKEFKLLQREESMERSLYDGSLSAITNLSDVREGDILEYAFTKKGYNPINNGNYASNFSFQYTIPVNHVYMRILSPDRLQYKLFDGADPPAINRSNGLNAYTWDIQSFDNLTYDNNTPSWYYAHKRVHITNYNQWKDVVQWALPLYKYDIEKVRKTSPFKSYPLNEKTIIDIINFVQDEVRYLGFESGIGAYKPHAPIQVLQQRYGDCKDKSLLLVALLRERGAEAYPLLVHSSKKEALEEYLPAHNIFDHCVVQFSYEGKDYYVDPTISSQGGDIKHLYFPSYKKGLLIKKGTSELIDIEDSTPPEINIKEEIYVTKIDEDAVYTVVTEYKGLKADNTRNYFENNTKSKIQKEYLNYISFLYPDIETKGELKYHDEEKNTTNKVIVEEKYRINNFWEQSDDSSYIYCNLMPLVIDSELNYPNTASRDMPYYLGRPHKINYALRVHLPEPWNIETEDEKIQHDAFVYTSNVHQEGNIVSISHTYELKKEYIEADQVKSFQKQIEKIENQINYQLTYGEEGDYAGTSQFLRVFFIALIFIGVIRFGKTFLNRH